MTRVLQTEDPIAVLAFSASSVRLCTTVWWAAGALTVLAYDNMNTAPSNLKAHCQQKLNRLILISWVTMAAGVGRQAV